MRLTLFSLTPFALAFSCVPSALAAGVDLPAAQPSEQKPNILFIFVDDMGFADPGCFGNPLVKTPNIDRLAEEGIKVTNFYVNSPICSPSRVAVTTGQYQGRWKIHSYLNTRAGNANRGMADYLDPAAPTTAKKLQAAGYVSGLIAQLKLIDSTTRILAGLGLAMELAADDG